MVIPAVAASRPQTTLLRRPLCAASITGRVGSSRRAARPLRAPRQRARTTTSGARTWTRSARPRRCGPPLMLLPCPPRTIPPTPLPSGAGRLACTPPCLFKVAEGCAVWAAHFLGRVGECPRQGPARFLFLMSVLVLRHRRPVRKASRRQAHTPAQSLPLTLSRTHATAGTRAPTSRRRKQGGGGRRTGTFPQGSNLATRMLGNSRIYVPYASVPLCLSPPLKPTP